MRPGLWLVLFIPLSNVVAARATDVEPPIAVVLNQVNAGRDEELYGLTASEFQAAVSRSQFRNVVRSVRQQRGRLQTWTEQESTSTIRVFRVQGERGSEIIKIALDSDGKISLLIFAPDPSNRDFDIPMWIRIVLIPISCFGIGRLMDRRLVREVGTGRQVLCGLIGAVVCLLIFWPLTPTVGRIAALAILGASCATVFGNKGALETRLSRTRLQIMWTLFGAVFGAVVGLVTAPAMPSFEFGAFWQEIVDFLHDPDHSITPIGDVIAKIFVGSAFALFFANADVLTRCLVSVLITIPTRCLGLHGVYPDYVGTSRSEGPSGDWLAGLVSQIRQRNKLVGLAASVLVDGLLAACAADGERQRGSGVPIELRDRWHLGSITKSITATMIARLVESGQMQWSDSIGRCFPDATIHEDWKPVTLRRLLTHTAGAQANFSFRVRLIRPAIGHECTNERQKAVLDVIAKRPAHRPGKKYVYSNVGYTIAGAMAEAVTEISWEDLVKREVFNPLELATAGFGPPKSSVETLDQPRGHRAILDWKVSVTDGDEADNTAVMGPAGTVHMSLPDLCTYVTEHLRGESGEGKLLTTETFKRLHTPELYNYACGWLKKDPTRDMPYPVYWHNGSNTMWYALVAFIPDKKMTVAVTANDGDFMRAESAAWSIVEASLKQLIDRPRY